MTIELIAFALGRGLRLVLEQFWIFTGRALWRVSSRLMDASLAAMARASRFQIRVRRLTGPELVDAHTPPTPRS